MTDKKQTTEQTEEKAPEPQVAASSEAAAQKDVPKTETDAPQAKDTTTAPERAPRKKNVFKRRRTNTRERIKPEFEHNVIDIRRVTRVVAGGRRFSFSTTVVAGNKKGRVGVGVGKANDTALSIEKALRAAKKSMVEIARTENNSIAFDVQAKYKSSKIYFFPALGKGLKAGGAARSVLELAGIQDVGAKILTRSKNKINNARATVEALMQLPGSRQAPATTIQKPLPKKRPFNKRRPAGDGAPRSTTARRTTSAPRRTTAAPAQKAAPVAA